MSRPTTLSLLALLLAVTTSTASAGGNLAASGSWHTDFEIGRATAAFTAVQHADGTVSGNLEVYQRSNNPQYELRIHASLDCLVIIGNQATMSGIISHAVGPSPGLVDDYSVGTRVIFTVVDNGEGKASPPD